MKKYFLLLLAMMFTACGNPVKYVKHQLHSEDKVVVQVGEQGVRLSLAPSTDVTYQSAILEIVRQADRVVVITTVLNLTGETTVQIPIANVNYCAVVHLVTTDGREGLGEVCFYLNEFEVKHLSIMATLSLTPQQGVVVTVTTPPVGSFTISADTSALGYNSRLVQMGTVNNKILRLKARGTSEAFTLTNIRITASNSANLVSVTITYPIDATQVTMESRIVVFVAGVADFSGLNWYIPQGVDSYAEVVTEINTDINGATSGDVAAASTILTAETQDADLSASGPTRVIGITSGAFVHTTATNADSVGNAVHVRKTILTIIKDAASPSGTGFVPGINEYLRFKITNSSGSTATVKQLKFTITGGDSNEVDWICGQGASYLVYDVTDQATILNDVAIGGTGCVIGADSTAYIVPFTTSPISIPASSTKTFILKFDSTGASSALDDSLRVDITNANDTFLGGLNDFIWNDGVADNNGFQALQLPVNGGNIQF